MSAGATLSWINAPFDSRKGLDFCSISFRCRNPFGSIPPHWLATDHDSSLSKVRVAADYSDSAPDSAKYTRDRGYHPLEEVKERSKNKDFSLTDVETARTLVEANSKALLVFPGRVHHEPHGHIAWAEFRYVIDDYGDIFFEVHDDENILQDHGANNPVTVLVGMDSPIFEYNNVVTSEFSDDMDGDDIIHDEDHYEIDTEITDILIQWGMPATMREIHPIYFAKCLTKAVCANHGKKMDKPSNGLSIVGYLRPAFVEEESYLRSLFHGDGDGESGDDDEGYISNWRDGGGLRFELKDDRSNINSTIYKLEIMTMELFSVYGNQSMIDLQDFQDAEPDVLANSASAIIERINEYGTQCMTALRTLCRKRKGLTVEGARLIGVDSLGIDVRIFSGMEARTLRFSFNARALTESAAEKKIKRMLFPRYYRKNLRAPTEGISD